ncbi:Succinate dehydrogenase assembly factor 4, mitochondrial [Fusarium keratoplasticum]|uniref:Succinate dehydrogenase assembly factor 4, mitochondrial n=1 Tax=Fusarium keratoplasticum TaxID=1328300 RepID=A0ACC0QJ19_9HYPO|nr:Succinate dehydrogenase assembly factor 4, mitochondrial [Fusarium keratoplasticum]KAI8654833.1 Succinate dehydrogenase assembly factor 4, mitochondrial [Fusarium keratoplasticum]KAI8655678.1 Succinate dehydrogenase assembly factor 4, mitochondrial [Fusarium keratoplasticum]
MSRLLTRRISPLLRLSTPSRLSSTFQTRPGPPKLPAEQQAEFERLQRAAAVSSAFQPVEEQAGATTPATSQARHATTPEKSEDVNQGLFRGAPPEFEGDTNPKTGEVGGPKNEPLRWGGEGDWSYNGRVTDF